MEHLETLTATDAAARIADISLSPVALDQHGSLLNRLQHDALVVPYHPQARAGEESERLPQALGDDDTPRRINGSE